MEYFNNLFENLAARVGDIIPGVAGAIAVLIIGWLFAAGIRRLLTTLFKKTKLDERFSKKKKASEQDGSEFELGRFIANLAYYLVLIYVIVLVLNMMGVEGVLSPLSGMLSEFLGWLPNIVAALIIGFAGYFIARFASESVGFISTGLQKLTAKAGVSTSINLVELVKQVVFVLVFIPLLITAIDTLGMDVISGPATSMFQDFLAMIPQILAAAMIIGVVYLIGRFVTDFLAKLLQNIGLDQLATPLGISRMTSDTLPLSRLIGHIAFFFIMFGGIIGAVEKLNLPQVTDILQEVFSISGKIFFGLVIFFIGNFLSDLAKKALSGSEENRWLGSIAKFAVLFIFLALGLNTMGIAEEIVNLAFGLTIGAVAVAVALAYGLGGREAAGRHAQELIDKIRGKNS